jgi:hypothetical protein
MFSGLFKTRRIKKYARKLPLELKMMFGREIYYSKEQVDDALKRKHFGNGEAFDRNQNGYAYAMFCSQQTFNQIVADQNVDCDYRVMRMEIAKSVYGGPVEFTFSTLVLKATNANSRFIGGGGFFSGDVGANDGSCDSSGE